MHKIKASVKGNAWDDSGTQEPFKRLTREQAFMLRRQNPSLSPWAVLTGQAAAGLTLALAVWLLTGHVNLGWSALYGALAVVVPSTLFCSGLDEQGLHDQSGRCGDWIFFVGNGEDRFGIGLVVCGTQTDNKFKLARHASGAGGDDEGGLVGALARCQSAAQIEVTG